VLTRAYSAAFVIHGESIPEDRPAVESSAVDIEVGEGKSVCMRPSFQKDSTSTALGPCRKRNVCAGLRRFAGQRCAGFTQTFFGCHSVSAPGGRAARSTQNAKIQICKNRNFKFAKSTKTKITKTFVQKCVLQD
jgi:hypothetical protein